MNTIYSTNRDIQKNIKAFSSITQKSYNPTAYEHTQAKRTQNYYKDYKPMKTRDINLTNPETKEKELERLMKLYYQVEYNKNVVNGNIQPAFNPSPYSDTINYTQTPVLNQKRAHMIAYSNLNAEQKARHNQGNLTQEFLTQMLGDNNPAQEEPTATAEVSVGGQAPVANISVMGGGGGGGGEEEGEL